MQQKQQGFTIIELLVAVGIIGILSSIAVVSIGNVRAKSRDSKRLADIKQVQASFEAFFNDQNLYPATPGGNGVLGETANAANAAILCVHTANNVTTAGLQARPAAGVCSGSTFLNPVPSNPTPNGAPYTYASVGGGTSYTVTFRIESGAGTLNAGAYEASPNGIRRTAD